MTNTARSDRFVGDPDLSDFEVMMQEHDAMVDLTVILTAKDVGDLPELRQLLATQVRMSRDEPGCVRFDALESQSAPGMFIVIERWESKAALDAHRSAEAITTVYLPRIMPLVERVLHECSVLPDT